MAVSVKDVEYVSKLARLEFEQNEIEKFVGEFNNILNFIEELSNVNTDNVEPTIGSYMQFNALREDNINQSFKRDDMMINAPEESLGYLKVPKVIE